MSDTIIIEIDSQYITSDAWKTILADAQGDPHQVYIDKGQCGNGGTTVALETVIDTDLSDQLCLILPNQEFAKLKMEELKDDPQYNGVNLSLIYGGEPIEPQATNSDKHIYVFVVDSFNQSPYRKYDVIVIDEYHKISLESGYRKAMQTFRRNLLKYHRNTPQIFLSATPIVPRRDGLIHQTDYKLLTTPKSIPPIVWGDHAMFNGSMMLDCWERGHGLLIRVVELKELIANVKFLRNQLGDKCLKNLSLSVGHKIKMQALQTKSVDDDLMDLILAPFDPSKRVLMVSNKAIEGWNLTSPRPFGVFMTVDYSKPHHGTTQEEIKQFIGRVRNDISSVWIGVETFLSTSLFSRSTQRILGQDPLKWEDDIIKSINACLDWEEGQKQSIIPVNLKNNPDLNQFYKGFRLNQLMNKVDKYGVNSNILEFIGDLARLQSWKKMMDQVEKVPCKNNEGKLLPLFFKGGHHHKRQCNFDVSKWNLVKDVNLLNRCNLNDQFSLIFKSEEDDNLNLISQYFGLPKNSHFSPLGLDDWWKKWKSTKTRRGIFPLKDGDAWGNWTENIVNLATAQRDAYLDLNANDIDQERLELLNFRIDGAKAFRTILSNILTEFEAKWADVLKTGLDKHTEGWNPYGDEMIGWCYEMKEWCYEMKEWCYEMKLKYLKQRAKNGNNKDKKQLEQFQKYWKRRTESVPYLIASILGGFLGLNDDLMTHSWAGGRCYNRLSRAGNDIADFVADAINEHFDDHVIYYTDANQLWFRLFMVYGGLGDLLKGVDDIYTINPKLNRSKAKVKCNTIANRWRTKYKFASKESETMHYKNLRNDLKSVTGCSNEQALKAQRRMLKLRDSFSFYILMSHAENEILKGFMDVNGIKNYHRLHDSIYTRDHIENIKGVNYRMIVGNEDMGLILNLFDSSDLSEKEIQLVFDVENLKVKSNVLDLSSDIFGIEYKAPASIEKGIEDSGEEDWELHSNLKMIA